MGMIAIAQDDNQVSPAFFRMTSFTGEFRLEGLYRKQTIQRSYLDDTDYNSLFSGSVLLNTHSFFWHPNFLQVDLGLEYSPEVSKNDYLIIPDEGELRTLKKLDLRTMLFQKKAVSLSTFANVSQTYSNREFLSNIRTDSKNYGGVFFFRNRFLPLSISYQQGEINQEEIQTGRLFNYSKFNRIEKDLPVVKTDLQDVLLNNELYFDRKQRYRFNSILNAADQTGYDEQKRFQAFETMSLKLPARFELIGNYNYYNVDRTFQEITQQTSRGILRHKLYESLLTNAYVETTTVEQTTFSETDRRLGIDFDYEKKIPAGELYLSYKYLFQQQDKKGESSALQIMHEEYTLTDGTIVLLKRPYVDQTTVMVRDVTGAILYQLNMDYILITRGNYIEIQRVPGGQIENKGTVYLDYVTITPGDYSYDMKNEYWSAGVSLFKQFLNIYYRHTNQDYTNLHQTDYVTLNYYTQQVYGLRLDYKGMSAGAEYDDNNSSILPYELMRYFASMQRTLSTRLMLSLNANISNYHLVLENEDQNYADLSGQLVYNLSSRSKINVEAGYRQQRGAGIDLDLMNSKVAYTLTMKQMYLSVGVQSYARNYMKEVDNYNGVFLRFSRRF
jgi:hypothetical protein